MSGDLAVDSINGNIILNISGNDQSPKADSSYTGVFVLNILTKKGSGYIISSANAMTYKVEIDMNSNSKLEYIILD